MAEYTTTDFYIAAALIANRHKVTKLSVDSSRKKRFHFEDTDELQQVVMSWLNSTLEGSLQGFKNAIEIVKTMIHSGN